MTRQRRRSKSQYHNAMKRSGYRFRRGHWWKRFSFTPLQIQVEYLTRQGVNPVCVLIGDDDED